VVGQTTDATRTEALNRAGTRERASLCSLLASLPLNVPLASLPLQSSAPWSRCRSVVPLTSFRRLVLSGPRSSLGSLRSGTRHLSEIAVSRTSPWRDPIAWHARRRARPDMRALRCVAIDS
jgi:hypothetical protein